MTVTRFVQNPGAPTSSHIFRDVDNGNLMAFFDYPEHGDAQVVRGIGAIQHVALKGSSDQYAVIISNLKEMKSNTRSTAMRMRNPSIFATPTISSSTFAAFIGARRSAAILML